MSVPTLDPSEAAGPSLLGPVNTVMGAIFDAVEEETPATPAEPGAETPPAAGTEPETPAEGAEPPAAGAEPVEPAEGAEGEPAAPAAAEVRPEPPVVTADDKVLVEQIGGLTEKLEERFTASFQQQAVEEAKADYPHYIELLNMHPLELIGKDLPSIDGTDNDVAFRTAEEIKDYQEAVKVILQRELEASVEQKRQESAEILDVVHASIELFRDNPDLVPGSKSYNKELATRFVKLAEPYALKMNGKLTGYSIPVQGLVDQVRAQVKAAAAAAPAATPPAKKAAAPAARPQAGIPAKAGASGEGEEDFTPMWNALGISNVPI